jgi:hypothetical protein
VSEFTVRPSGLAVPYEKPAKSQGVDRCPECGCQERCTDAYPHGGLVYSTCPACCCKYADNGSVLPREFGPIEFTNHNDRKAIREAIQSMLNTSHRLNGTYFQERKRRELIMNLSLELVGDDVEYQELT